MSLRLHTYEFMVKSSFKNLPILELRWRSYKIFNKTRISYCFKCWVTVFITFARTLSRSRRLPVSGLTRLRCLPRVQKWLNPLTFKFTDTRMLSRRRMTKFPAPPVNTMCSRHTGHVRDEQSPKAPCSQLWLRVCVDKSTLVPIYLMR